MEDVSVIFDEPIDKYHGDRTTLGSTQINIAERSPSLFQDVVELGRGSGFESDSLTLGKVWHRLLELGHERFGDHAHLAPPAHCTAGGGLSTKKETREWVASLGPDAIVLTPDMSDKLEQMWLRFQANSMAVTLHESAVTREPSIRWTTVGGIRVRCRPDLLCEGGVLADYKSTSCSNILKDFRWSVRDYGYGISAALYEQGVTVAGLAEPPMHYIVTQTVSPFCTQVLTLPPSYMEWARKRLDEVLLDIASRRESGVWTDEGYGKVNELAMPGFGDRGFSYVE